MRRESPVYEWNLGTALNLWDTLFDELEMVSRGFRRQNRPKCEVRQAAHVQQSLGGLGRLPR